MTKASEASRRPEHRLTELGIELPPPAARTGHYLPLVMVGDLAFVSGHASTVVDSHIVGTLGADLDITQGTAAARAATLSALVSLRDALGSLDRIRRFVKVLGMIRSTSEFDAHPTVMNGCSDLLIDIFGERGKHARSAVGMSSLPGNSAVEVEMIVQVVADERL